MAFVSSSNPASLPFAGSCPGRRHSAWLWSGLCCTAILLAFIAVGELNGSDQLLHWCLIPILLGGLLITVDAVRWFTGELDVFDPIGIVGLFGVHFFLLAPLLHLAWDYWIAEVQPPADWRLWLGGMAVLNFLGLLAYWGARRWVCPPNPPAPKRIWRLEPSRFRRLLPWALLVTACLQMTIYAQYGGLKGYITAVEREEHVFFGVQRIAMISESFPLLALMGYAVFTWGRPRPSWPRLLAVLVAFVLVKFLFGGLHGSRNNIVFAVFWAVGIIHFAIRPIPKSLILAGTLALIPFGYLYGFYKSAGVHGLERALTSAEARADTAARIHRPIQSTVLADLGRSDVQAYLLYRMQQPNSDYSYGLGRTYVGGVVIVLPGFLWRDRPPTKVKEGTQALLGREAYRERPLESTYSKDRFDGMSSRVYGITGEAMLNFGPWSVPLAMAVFGLIMGWVRRCLLTWPAQDMRRLLLPFLVNLGIILLLLDSDNLVTMLEQNFFTPLVFVFLSSARSSRAEVVPSLASPNCHQLHSEGCS